MVVMMVKYDSGGWLGGMVSPRLTLRSSNQSTL